MIKKVNRRGFLSITGMSALIILNLSAQDTTKTINLDAWGDMRIGQADLCPTNPYKKVVFISQQARKVIVPTGTIFQLGSWARESIVFCGKAQLVVEPGASLNFTGQTLCMSGSSQISFIPPAQ